jgi:RNA polymerase sigma factor (sigma-70 family)
MIDKETTLREWLPYAKAIAVRFAACYRHFDRDDFESAACLAVAETIERFNGTSPLEKWMRRTIKHRLQDVVALAAKRSVRRGRLACVLSLHNRVSDDESMRHVDAIADRREASACSLTNADIIAACMKSLVEREQTILLMRLQGYTANEITDAVGLPASTFWYHWKKIAAHIATALGRPERASEVANCFRGKRA